MTECRRPKVERLKVEWDPTLKDEKDPRLSFLGTKISIFRNNFVNMVCSFFLNLACCYNSAALRIWWITNFIKKRMKLFDCFAINKLFSIRRIIFLPTMKTMSLNCFRPDLDLVRSSSPNLNPKLLGKRGMLQILALTKFDNKIGQLCRTEKNWSLRKQRKNLVCSVIW